MNDSGVVEIVIKINVESKRGGVDWKINEMER